MFRQPRNWNMTTVARGHDTRLLKKHGSQGNSGTLVFSIPIEMGDKFLDKYANGMPYVHVRIDKRGDTMLLFPVKEGERGRKFSAGPDRKDYRVFFDPGNYQWIDDLEPFSSTETESSLVDGGIKIMLPPAEKRVPAVPYTEAARPRSIKYTPPKPSRPYPLDTAPTARLAEPASRASVQSVHPASPGEGPAMQEGHLYLVMVPPEKDEKFHTLLKFLKLEALKE